MILHRWNSAVVLPLLLLLVIASGCTKEQAPPPVETKPRLTEQEIARQMEEMRLKQYKQKFESLQQAIRSYPERYDEWIVHLEDMIYAAEGTAYAVKAKKLLDDQIAVREAAGKKHYEELASGVESLLSDGDPLAAERLLEGFDSETFGKTGAHQDWLNLRQQVAMRLQAEVEFDRITTRARAYRRQSLPFCHTFYFDFLKTNIVFFGQIASDCFFERKKNKIFKINQNWKGKKQNVEKNPKFDEQKNKF